MQLETALAQVNHFKESAIVNSNIGKHVRLYRGPEINEKWFVPWTPHWHIDGTITSVYWQYGDTPLYIVLFDGGFEGAFFCRKKLLKYL